MRRTAVLLLAFLVTMAIPAGPSLTLAQSTDWPSVIRAVRPAVVWILVETDEDLDDAGTGAILSEDGYILTAHHVIEDATGEISVIVEEKYRYTASVISSDADADIAILKIPATGLTWVPLGDSDQVDIEEEIRVFGYPLPGAGVGLIVVSGIIQGTRTRDGVRWLQHNATTAGGHSGGPVVNSQGQIIAVHSRVLVEQPEYRLATAVNEARQFIPSGVLPVGTPTPAPLTTYTVSGRVTTSSGSGVAGVSITFSRTSGTGTIPGSVTTDSNGRWTRTGFASGTTYRATPSQSGYTFSPSSRTFSSASTSVSFTRGTPSSPTPTPTPPSPSTPPSGMVLIPAGSFQMGDSAGSFQLGDSFGEGDPGELPVHSVYVSAFYMDAYEVTKALWDEVANWASRNGYDIGPSDGSGKAPDHPVCNVTWYEAVKWCNARSEKEGITPAYYTSAARTTVYRTGEVNVQNDWVRWDTGYRLPTEAEWEKAARGGCEGRRFPWCDADTITHSRANYQSSSNYSYDTSLTRGFHPTYETGSKPYTSPVGSFAPNGYGLYDVAGNVSEWCWDWYSSIYYASSPGSDPRGPASGSTRVRRGGGCGDNANDCRVANRGSYWPGLEYRNLGFRLVRTAP